MTITSTEMSLFFRSADVVAEGTVGASVRELVSEGAFKSVARFMRKLMFVREVKMEKGATFKLQHSDPCLHMILPVAGNLEVHTQTGAWKLMPDDFWQWHSHQQHKSLVFNSSPNQSRFIHIGLSELDGETMCLPFDMEKMNELSHLNLGSGMDRVKLGLGVFNPSQIHKMYLENAHRNGMVLCLDGQCKVGGELLSNGDVMMFRDHGLLNIQSVSSHSFLLTLENAMLNLV